MTTKATGDGAKAKKAKAKAAEGAGEASAASEAAGAADAADAADTSDESGTSDERTWSGSWSARDIPLADNIHGLVDDIIENVRAFAPMTGGRFPRCDFIETPAAYLLVFDLPGIDRKEISVTTEADMVIVAGERAKPEWGDDATVRRSERTFGKFRRGLGLPADVLIDDIGARYEDGILTVTLPRRTESPERKVDIEG